MYYINAGYGNEKIGVCGDSCKNKPYGTEEKSRTTRDVKLGSHYISFSG